MPTEPVHASIGARIQRARLQRGISLRQMAEVLGMHHSTLSSREHDVTDHDLGMRETLAIAHYLEIDLAELIPAALIHPSHITPYSRNGPARPPRRRQTPRARKEEG
jgi:transcriptional regulator with XRE-family HTH domain